MRLAFCASLYGFINNLYAMVKGAAPIVGGERYVQRQFQDATGVSKSPGKCEPVIEIQETV